MLKSITEDNSNELTKEANRLGIKKEQIVGFSSTEHTVSMFYYVDESKRV